MAYYILYETDTGRIAVTGDVPLSQIDAQAAAYPEYALLLGEANGKTQYIENGVIVDMPAKPNDVHTFDYSIKQWVDARDISETRNKAIATINKRIGQVRSKFITIIPGQESIYLAKEAEAIRFMADANADIANYPLISAEVGITATTAYELAQVWLYMAEQWREVAAQLEALRLTAKDSVMNAVSNTAVDTVLNDTLAALELY